MPVGVGSGSSSGSSTTPTTFADLYTDLLNRVRTDATNAANLVFAKRYINAANHDLHIQQNWPWAERSSVLLTHATYTTGTISITAAARTTVTGSSTLWNTAVTGMGFNNARAGGKLVFSGSQDVYTVSSVDSDTQITLTSRYVGDALSGATYTYYEDEYALASDFWRVIDSRTFWAGMDLPVLGRQEFYLRYPRNNKPIASPQACTIVELGPSGSTAGRPRLVLAPPPNQVLSLPYRYITSNLAVSSAGVGAANMSATDDEPIIPVRYRMVLVFHALAQWYRDRKDDARSQEANGEYVDLVKRMANDSAPERDVPRLKVHRRQYLSQVAGPYRRTGRVYQTGSEFDDMVI